MRILIVEDEMDLGRYNSRALLEASHDPLLVHDGETAIGELQEKNYELIILDVMLPGIDGFQVLRRVPGQDGFPRADPNRAWRCGRSGDRLCPRGR